jgi:outer membrane receptor protein involved in Fe transport
VADYKNWFGSLQLRYFGPRPLIEDNSVRSAATSLANLRIGYKLAPRTRVILDIFNLFNREASDIDYFYASQLRAESASVDGITFHPAEPRSVRVALVHHF